MNIIFPSYFACLWWLLSFDRHSTEGESIAHADALATYTERLIRLGESPRDFRRIANSWQRRSTRMEQRKLEMLTMIRWRCACLWTLVSCALMAVSGLSQQTASPPPSSLYIAWIGFFQLAAIEFTMKLIPSFPANANVPRGAILLQLLFEICSRGYSHSELLAWRLEEISTGEDQQKPALNWIKGEFAQECARYRKCIKKWSDIRTIIELTLCGAPCLSVLFTA